MSFHASARERRLITGVILVAELVMIYFLIFEPKLRALDSAKAELISLNTIYEMKKNKAKLLPMVEESYLKNRTEYLAAKNQFFTSGEIESFVKTFSSLARGAMVDLSEIRPYKEPDKFTKNSMDTRSKANEIRRQQIQIVMTGTYGNILELLKVLESERKAIAIDQLDIQRPPDKQKLISVTMVVSLYWIMQSTEEQG